MDGKAVAKQVESILKSGGKGSVSVPGLDNPKEQIPNAFAGHSANAEMFPTRQRWWWWSGPLRAGGDHADRPIHPAPSGAAPCAVRNYIISMGTQTPPMTARLWDFSGTFSSARGTSEGLSAAQSGKRAKGRKGPPTQARGPS